MKRALGLLFLVSLIVGGLVFVNRILLADAFNREEAQHALYSLWLWRDIRALDFGAFWYDTQRQMVWPFLHSWLLSVVFLVFGVSYVAAHSLSLIIYFASLFLIYLLALKISKKSGRLIAIISVVLALTSPLMIRFASENMIEGLSALLFLAAAYTYTICEERKITLEYFVLALLIGLSILTNYIYAYIMVMAFLVVTISRLGPITREAVLLSRKGEKNAVHFIWWAYRKMIVLGILLALVGGWFSFSFSRKVIVLVQTVFKYSGDQPVLGLWPNLLYYPRVIISNLNFSPWIGVLLVVSLLVPFVASRFSGLHRLYMYVWTALLLATLTLQAKLPQMIYVVVPFIFIIFSAALTYVLEHSQFRAKRVWLLGVLIVLFLPILVSLPQAYVMFFPYRPAQNMVQVLDYFEATVPPGVGAVIPFNVKRLNPEVAQFHFRDWQGRLLTDPQMFEASLLDNNEYFLTLTLDDNSYYQKEVTDDSLNRWNAWLEDRLMEGQVRLFDNRYFSAIGVTAKIYQKASL